MIIYVITLIIGIIVFFVISMTTAFDEISGLPEWPIAPMIDAITKLTFTYAVFLGIHYAIHGLSPSIYSNAIYLSMVIIWMSRRPTKETSPDHTTKTLSRWTSIWLHALILPAAIGPIHLLIQGP